MERRSSLFDRWPTGAVLLLLLSAALLPLGLVLAWAANQSVGEAEGAHIKRANEQALEATRAIESLIARNAMALRIAANGALAATTTDPCAFSAQSLALTPAVGRRFRIRDTMGRPLCDVDGFTPERNDLVVAPGDIRMWVSPQNRVLFRAGLVGGSVTGFLTSDELRQAAGSAAEDLYRVTISDGATQLVMLNRPVSPDVHVRGHLYEIGNKQLRVGVTTSIERTLFLDQLVMLMPLLMWVVATLFSWALVRRLLLQPLARLQRAVTEYQPGEERLELPTKYGVASEIRDLSLAFERAVDRIEGAEREAIDALEGQRKLVREVHHRVKNNLQVVASLLSIHGRTAEKTEAKAAYSAIGRRVDALSVVHRNHYAELEESRGIALRPLLTELAAGLRASAPPEARAMSVELELDTTSTTQDNAVAAAFLITEIVEFAMLRRPGDPVEISLRRVDELTATLSLSSSILVPESEPDDLAKNQFERIVEGLARQLRSPLDRKLGRYAVALPVFPEI